MAACAHCGRHVAFEVDESGDSLRRECGWSQSARRLGPPIGSQTKRLRKGWARAAAVLLLIQGVLSIASFIGMVDIVISIGLFRLRERTRDLTVVLSIFQLVLMIAAGYAAIVVSQYSMFKDYLAVYLILLPILGPIKIITVIILTRPAVKAAFVAPARTLWRRQ